MRLRGRRPLTLRPLGALVALRGKNPVIKAAFDPDREMPMPAYKSFRPFAVTAPRIPEARRRKVMARNRSFGKSTRALHSNVPTRKCHNRLFCHARPYHLMHDVGDVAIAAKRVVHRVDIAILFLCKMDRVGPLIGLHVGAVRLFILIPASLVRRESRESSLSSKTKSARSAARSRSCAVLLAREKLKPRSEIYYRRPLQGIKRKKMT